MPKCRRVGTWGNPHAKKMRRRGEAARIGSGAGVSTGNSGATEANATAWSAGAPLTARSAIAAKKEAAPRGVASESAMCYRRLMVRVVVATAVVSSGSSLPFLPRGNESRLNIPAILSVTSDLICSANLPAPAISNSTAKNSP